MSAERLESGRVEWETANMQAGGSKKPDFANDSLALSLSSRQPNSRGSRGNVTARRVAEVASGLTAIDRILLSTVARLNVASGSQLRQLAYPDTATGRRLARKDLARLTELRVIARLDRRVGGVRAGSAGYVYALDVIGQRLTRPGRRRYRPPWTPGPHQVAHALAVSQLYVDLKAAEGPAVTLGRFDAEPAAWRSYAGPGGGRLTLKPDAFAVLQTDEFEDHFFIEVDRATESTTRIATKAKAYVRYWQSGREQAEAGLFPRVLWVAPTDRRASQLAETLTGLPPEHWQLFAVTTTQRAARQMAGINTSINPPKEVTP